MTWTYDNDPGTATAAQRRDGVRLRVGDTDTNDELKSDEEIAFFLDLSDNDIDGAAIQAAESIAAKFGRQVQISQGPVSAGAQSKMQQYLDIAEAIRKARRRKGAPFFAGGLSKSGKEALDEDDDAVQPNFSVGMDDNPPRFNRNDLDRC